MNKVTYTPATTALQVVEVSPASFTLQLTVDQMVMLTTLVGITTNGSQMYELYVNMLKALRANNLTDKDVSVKQSVYSDEVLLKGN